MRFTPEQRVARELHWLQQLLAPGEALVGRARGELTLNRASFRRGLAEMAQIGRRLAARDDLVDASAKVGLLLVGEALLWSVTNGEASLDDALSQGRPPPAIRLARCMFGATAHRFLAVGIGETRPGTDLWHGPLWSAGWTWSQLGGAAVVLSRGRIVMKDFVDLDLGAGDARRTFRGFATAEAPHNRTEAERVLEMVARSVVSSVER